MPAKKIASKPQVPPAGPQPPYDLARVRAANRQHAWERYGRPIAPRFLPAELVQLQGLRDKLNVHGSDASVVKACFDYAQKALGSVRQPKGSEICVYLTHQELEWIGVCLRLRIEAIEDNKEKPARALVTAAQKIAVA